MQSDCRLTPADQIHLSSTSKVTTAQVFAIAGPAMIANLTTPLIGIVSTIAIGRLGDATPPSSVASPSRPIAIVETMPINGVVRFATIAGPAMAKT